MKKRVIVLGSTGSIGRSALEVLQALAYDWEIVGLAAGSKASQLAQQANRVHPQAIAIVREDRMAQLKEALDYAAEIFAGDDALVALLNAVDFDCAVCAVVGAAGLAATLRAVELGKRVALANKEALVVAGSLVLRLAKSSGAEIIPVDSEHSAVFQAMHAGHRDEVRRVYLTASGGPFRNWTVEAMDAATVSDALQHPTWDMGPKITIDSATMMNKAMEVVEARWLFDLDPERIDVLVHPESVVHSMVEFCDGSMIAQMGTPDMRTPIQYALTYPARHPCPSESLDLAKLGRLTFQTPDLGRFPALSLGYQVARRGGTCGAVFNAANERAVELFRDGGLGFCDIARVTEQALREHEYKKEPTLDDLLAADRWARDEVARCKAC